MSETLKFGNGQWAVKKGSTLAYNDEGNNYKPLPFTFDRSTSATRVNKEGLIEVVSNKEPRIDFKDSSEGALLLEPSRTNYVTYSEDFSDASWVKSAGTTLTSNYGIAPNGLNQSTLIEWSSTQQFIYTIISSQGQETSSIYIKGISGQEIKFGRTDSVASGNLFTFDGTWQRLEISTDNVVTVLFLSTFNDGNATDFEIWGAQLEAGSYATSYIPTSGGVVTRIAESTSQTVPSGIIGQTEGVFYAEIKANETSDVSVRRTISLSDSTNSNRIYISFDDEYNKLNIFLIVGNTVVTTSNVDISNQNSFNKIAIKYKSGDSSIYVNGVLKNSFNDTFSGGNFNTLKFSNRGTGEVFNGNVKDVRVYNTALTDQELIALTS